LFLVAARYLFLLVIIASNRPDSSRRNIDSRFHYGSANLNGCYCNRYNSIRHSDDSATGAEKWKQQGKKYGAHLIEERWLHSQRCKF
jgi:hypothetical protein